MPTVGLLVRYDRGSKCQGDLRIRPLPILPTKSRTCRIEVGEWPWWHRFGPDYLTLESQ